MLLAVGVVGVAMSLDAWADVYMSVCIYIYIYIHIYKYIYIHIYINTNIYISIPMYTHVNIYIYICMYMNTHLTYLYVNILMCIYIFKHSRCCSLLVWQEWPWRRVRGPIYIHVHIHIYICTHSYTHTHTYIYMNIYLTYFYMNIYIQTYICIYTHTHILGVTGCWCGRSGHGVGCVGQFGGSAKNQRRCLWS